MTVGGNVENNNDAISSYLHIVASALKRAVSGVNVTRRLDIIMRMPDPIEEVCTKHQTTGFGFNAVKCAPVDASVISLWPEKEYRHKASVDRPYAKETYKCHHSL